MAFYVWLCSRETCYKQNYIFSFCSLNKNYPSFSLRAWKMQILIISWVETVFSCLTRLPSFPESLKFNYNTVSFYYYMKWTNINRRGNYTHSIFVESLSDDEKTEDGRTPHVKIINIYFLLWTNPKHIFSTVDKIPNINFLLWTKSHTYIFYCGQNHTHKFSLWTRQIRHLNFLLWKKHA